MYESQGAGYSFDSEVHLRQSKKKSMVKLLWFINVKDFVALQI